MALVYRFQNVSDCMNTQALAGKHLAFGVFDGVHIGHISLVNEMLAHASKPQSLNRDAQNSREKNPSDAQNPSDAIPNTAILTFDKDPDELLFPDKTKKLMTNAERISELSKLPVESVFVLPFNTQLASLDANDFLNGLFGAGVASKKGTPTTNSTTPASIHVGEGFKFGHRAMGSADLMRSWAAGTSCEIFEVPLLCAHGSKVSSTRIRGLLSNNAANNLHLANKLLGKPFSVSGRVSEGRHEGTQFGFATANLNIPHEFDVLEHGVYAAYAYIQDASNNPTHSHIAAVSVGTSPTFANAQANIEAHILDFNEDIYGKQITLKFKKYLRPMKKFDNTQDLICAIDGDVSRVRETLG